VVPPIAIHKNCMREEFLVVGYKRFNSIGALKAVLLLAGFLFVLSLAGCGKEKEIITYRERPAPVSLAYPPADTFLTINNPTFHWNRSGDAVLYELQVANAGDFVSKSIDVQLSDTTYTAISPLPNGTHYWRVRGENLDGVWGDWSDAEIRIFYKSDYVNYFELISETETMGIAQDVFLRNDTAYVADGQADLTIFDVSDPMYPYILRNIDSGNDDFAKGVYVSPVDTFPYAVVADMDGRIQCLNVQDTTFLVNDAFGTDQNLEDITGIIKNDSLWIMAVSSGFNRRRLSFYLIVYDPYFNPWFSQVAFSVEMPADANGLYADTNYVYVACGTSGLKIVDIRDIYNPIVAYSLPMSGSMLSVDVRHNPVSSRDYAFVAADRGGVYVVDVTDKSNPLVIEQINTSGRSKDVHAVGDYVFVADGSGGLKVIDATVPDSAHFVAAYTTPYAYGLYATTDYIYLCDRDLGLLIFENRTSR